MHEGTFNDHFFEQLGKFFYSFISATQTLEEASRTEGKKSLP